MNKLINLILLAIASIVATSCENDSTFSDPVIHEFSAAKTNIVVGESVEVKINADADYLSIWDGKPKSEYDKIKEDAAVYANNQITEEVSVKVNNKGKAIKKGQTSFQLKYAAAGTYKVVLLARNVEDYTGKIKETTARLEIVVSASK